MNWMKLKWLYFLISGLVIIPGLYSLIRFGLNPAIDFTGGALLELRFKQDIPVSDYTEIENIVTKEGFKVSSIQSSGEKTLILRMNPASKDEADSLKNKLGEKYGGQPEELSFETVGPTLGRELLIKTVMAVILASLFITFYVGWQFRNKKFGICAILAMFHDSLVLLGSFSILGHFLGAPADTLFVTAMLTILSFSVHDTVVVYDRIRESQKILPDVPFEDLVNKAVTETLSRSLNNSLTIIFMLTALMLLGGSTIKWFVVALLIGTISGTYSSTFTAAPLLVVWEKLSFVKKK